MYSYVLKGSKNRIKERLKRWAKKQYLQHFS